jgi:hypothetical protein
MATALENKVAAFSRAGRTKSEAAPTLCRHGLALGGSERYL